MELKPLFQDIANAIREVDKTEDKIVASDFPKRIRAFIKKVEPGWFSPKMTSNNTPGPYVVDASSVWSESGALKVPWYAFDGDTSSWWGANLEVNCWISFDFGEIKSVKGFRMFPRYGQHAQMPRDYRFEGSLDGQNWEEIYSKTGLPTPNNFDWRAQMLDTEVSYRYYRFSGMRSNYQFPGAVSISEIEFYVTK